jgi:hypothetical protein
MCAQQTTATGCTRKTRRGESARRRRTPSLPEPSRAACPLVRPLPFRALGQWPVSALISLSHAPRSGSLPVGRHALAAWPGQYGAAAQADDCSDLPVATTPPSRHPQGHDNAMTLTPLAADSHVRPRSRRGRRRPSRSTRSPPSPLSACCRVFQPKRIHVSAVSCATCRTRRCTRQW